MDPKGTVYGRIRKNVKLNGIFSCDRKEKRAVAKFGSNTKTDIYQFHIHRDTK